MDKGFGVVNEAEVDVFLELSCLFYDPTPSRFIIAFAPLVPLQIKSLLGFCRMPRAGKWDHPATDPSISVWASSLTSHWGSPLILGSSSVWLNIPGSLLIMPVFGMGHCCLAWAQTSFSGVIWKSWFITSWFKLGLILSVRIAHVPDRVHSATLFWYECPEHLWSVDGETEAQRGKEFCPADGAGGAGVWSLVTGPQGFPGDSAVKNLPACQCRRCRFDPWLGRSPGGGNG